MKKSLGIYVHVPFCLKKCNYCDFCSFSGSVEKLGEAYVNEIIRRIRSFAQSAQPYVVDTVYFGGGTPSLLPSRLTKKLIDTINSTFHISDSAEITLECNPATADYEKLFALRNMGFSRLSIGLQSALDSELALLGRAHTKEDFVNCFEDARRAGFENISVDLMYGIPEQTLESLEHSAKFVTSLSPEHISAYGLMIEEGTDFYHRRDTLIVADDDMQAQMYSLLCKLLENDGYSKYEISNFARDGFESRHNLRYWQGLEYLGFGVAAHSYFEGKRFGNSRDIISFLDGRDITEECQSISENEKRREFVMLGLRLVKGISKAEYFQRFGRQLERDFHFERYAQAGFMTNNDDSIAFTEKGFLVSNAILAELIYGQ